MFVRLLRSGQMEIVADGKQPDDQNKQRRDNEAGEIGDLQPSVFLHLQQRDVGQSTDERSGCVEIVHEHGGNPPRHHVAQNAAANGGKHAAGGESNRPQMIQISFRDAQRREHAQPERVANENHLLMVFQTFEKKEDDKPRNDASRQIDFILQNGHGRGADHRVPHDAAADSDQTSEHDDAEHVKP